MRKPCITVSFSGEDHFHVGPTWYLEWLPEGFGPHEQQRLVCAFPDPDGRFDDFHGKDKPYPPEIEVVKKALEEYYRANPPAPPRKKSWEYERISDKWERKS